MNVLIPVCVCVYRRVDGAYRAGEKESNRQAAAVLGLPIRAKVSSLFLCLFKPPHPWRLRVDLYSLVHTLTHIDTLAPSQANTAPTKRPQMVVWMSEDIHCKVKYWKGSLVWQFYLLSLLRFLCMRSCLCARSFFFGYLQDSSIS